MGVWLDDEFPEHPKVEALDDDLARWLYVAGLCYANRNLTGGRIPKGAALRLTDRASRKLIDKLLATLVPDEGPLWEDHGDHYRIHNYGGKQQSAEKRREEKERAKLARTEHARRAAAARWAAEHGQPDGQESSIDRASPEHPPGINRADPGAEDEHGDFLAPPPPQASAAERATPAQPNALVPIDRSSSSNTGVGDEPAEEEEPLGRIDQACTLVAQRRLERRLTKPELEPITDRPAWLARTADRERQRIAADPAFAENMRRLADAGITVERMADLLDPPERPAPSPYPDAGEHPAPTYDQVRNDAGEWVTVRVGA